MPVINLSNNLIIAHQLQVANTFWKRFKGLMGSPSLPKGTALLIQPCSSIHTCFMRYPIDVVFLDRNHRVVQILHSFPPYRFSPLVSKAKAVLELPAGHCQLKDIKNGDLLKIIEVTANEKN